MATEPSRTDTVGIPDWDILIPKNESSPTPNHWPYRKLWAMLHGNGRYQVRKLKGIWCIVNPRGRIIMYSTDAAQMRRWAIRYAYNLPTMTEDIDNA